MQTFINVALVCNNNNIKKNFKTFNRKKLLNLSNSQVTSCICKIHTPHLIRLNYFNSQITFFYVKYVSQFVEPEKIN